MDLPAGVVTFLMTDIEGSTRLWDEAPEAMRAALVRHDDIVCAAIGEHEGFLIKARGEGDSTFSVFARATDAVVAACGLQAALTSEPWPHGAPLSVRIAVHTGEADRGVDDYYGTAVNRCARLRSIAHGGQVLVSESTTGLVREALPEEVALRDLGFQRLRDLAEPERVSQLLHASLASDFPALRTIDSIPNNLPYQVSTFVGRDADMTKIRDLLRDTRLLTLTGTGGVGKTRLALQAAAEMLYEYPDGVWLVELAALSDGGLAWQVLATVLEVREEPGRPLAETIVGRLRAQQALVVLDNCEHLVDASAALAEQLTRQCPKVTILATSREALRAEGETVWRVPSLSVPHRVPGAEPQPEQLTQYAAVRLFVDRATKVKPGFAITNANAPAVAEICSRLEGVPLAIELAAARANTLSPQQIEQRLDERFRLLTGGRRTALPRQQTLEATVRWSYALLPEAEQRLFARLSVFAGGFTLEAAEAVCAGDGAATSAVAELLGELASKSLVIPGTGRYWMLETLRAYGRQRLTESGETEAPGQSHASYFTDFAEQMRMRITGPGQVDSLRHLDSEDENLRAALAWGLTHDVATTLRLAAALQHFWILRGHWSEGREWVTRSMARSEVVPLELRAQGLYAAGLLALAQHDLDQARPLLRDALAAARQCGHRPTEASALNTLGNVAASRGDYDEAKRLHEEGLSIRQELGDRHAIASSLHNVAQDAHERRDYAAARALYEEVCAIWRELGDQIALSATLNNLGNLATDLCDYEAAQPPHEEALALRRRVGDKPGVAGSLTNLGRVLQERGDHEGARAYYGESLALGRELGYRRVMGVTLGNLGNLAADQGNWAESRELHREELAIWRDLGHKPGEALSLSNLASCLSEEGRYEEARRLGEEGLAVAREIEDQRCVANALHQLGRIALGEEHYEESQRLYREGLRAAREIRFAWGLVIGIEGLGRTAVADGDSTKAAKLFGAAGALRESMGAPMTQHQRVGILTGLEESLGRDAFAAALVEGKAMSLDEALALALDEGAGA